VWLSGLLPYEQGRLVWARIGEREIPARSVWGQVQYHSPRLQAYVEHQTQTLSENLANGSEEPPHNQAKGISMDGGMVNTLGAGWKEVKVGVVFDLETDFEPHPIPGHLTPMAPGSMYITLPFWAVKSSLAVTQHLPSASRHAVVADGTARIWDIADYLFPQAQQLVDWYHASHHLAGAAQSLCPNDETQRHTWYTTMRAHL
jgi:hypothetical protein